MHCKRFSISCFEICSYCLIGYFVFNCQYTLEMINILETPLLLNNKEFCLTNHITIHLKLIHPRNSRRAHIYRPYLHQNKHNTIFYWGITTQ